MDTEVERSNDQQDATVDLAGPEEVVLEPNDEYFVHPLKDVDRGLGLPLREGHARPVPVHHHHRSGFGAPAIAFVMGLLIAGFVLFNLWSAGEVDGGILGTLLLWGAGFSAVVYFLIRTP